MFAWLDAALAVPTSPRAPSSSIAHCFKCLGDAHFDGIPNALQEKIGGFKAGW